MPSFPVEDPPPSTQLRHELLTSITRSLSTPTRRPLLTHLNADTTWLLSLPCPNSSNSYTSPKSRKRLYYHILIDPWLLGPQSDVAGWFSTQWHAEPSAVQSISEIEEVVKRIEALARDPEARDAEAEDVIVVDTDMGRNGEESRNGGMDVDGEKEEGYIDVVVISHEFTDHMHKPTLLSLSPHTPILATPAAHKIIKSWRHFTTVLSISTFAGDWRANRPEGNLLPEWIGVSRVAYKGNDLLYYHSAIMITFSSSQTNEEEAEAVIYTPHGISPSDLTPIVTANPKIRTLALLHGLQDISLGWRAQLNMGANNGLRAQRLLKAKYWIGTHDEVKKGGGVVSWFLDRKMLSLKDAIEKESAEGKAGGEVRFEEVENGGSLVLK